MFKLFTKDLKLFLKDRQSVLLTFLLPIILISLFAFAFGGIGGGSNDFNPIQLLITDLDETKHSQNIISKLDSLQTVELKIVKLEDAKSAIKKGDAAAVLVFEKGFEKAANAGEEISLELLYDKAREIEIGMLQPILIGTVGSSTARQNVSNNIQKYLEENFPGTSPEFSEKILNDIVERDGGGASFKMNPSIKMTSMVGEEKENNLGLIQAVAGTAIMMLLFSVAGLGASMLEEKENGTLSRLLYSPLKPENILFGKMLFAFFIALIQLTLMFGFAFIAFGLNIFAKLPALLLMIVATAFAVSSFGIFLAAVAKTRQQAQSLSTLIILIMSAIGGSMIPLFIMPAIMKKIAVVSVNYWGIQGFYDIFWRELPLLDILPRLGVLLAMGVVMSLISLRLFQRNVLKLV